MAVFALHRAADTLPAPGGALAVAKAARRGLEVRAEAPASQRGGTAVGMEAADAEISKHLSGKHNQKTHGRGTPTRAAYRTAYASARKGGASVGDARAAGRAAAGGARAGEKERAAKTRTERLQTQALRARQAANSGQVTEAQKARLIERADRLEARARGEKVGARESGLFGREYQERQRELQSRPSAEAPRTRTDAERARFLEQQALAGGSGRAAVLPPRTREEEDAARARMEDRRTRALASLGEGGTPPTSPPFTAPSRVEAAEYRAVVRAAGRVQMSGAGWNEPASDKQRSWLKDLVGKARSNTKEGSPQRAVADELASNLSGLTKWEASSLIDGLRQPKPLTTLIDEAHSAVRLRRNRASQSEAGPRTPVKGEALFALPSFRTSLIGRVLDEDAQAEGLPF